MSSFLWVLYILHIVRSVIQGMGNTVIPLVSGIFEFIMRTGATLILPVLFGENGILFAEVLAWMGADLVLIPGYFYMRKSCFRADRTRVMFKAQFEVLRKRKTSPTAGGSGWKLLCRRAGFFSAPVLLVVA